MYSTSCCKVVHLFLITIGTNTHTFNIKASSYAQDTINKQKFPRRILHVMTHFIQCLYVKMSRTIKAMAMDRSMMNAENQQVLYI